MKNSGIYMITCKANGDRYIGSSRNTVSRKSTHWCHLRVQNHHNSHMQSVWNKYGEDSFRFEVLEKVKDTEFLIEREQFWIDKLNPELNKTTRADSGFLGRNHSKETRKKLSEIQKERMKSLEMRERLRQAAIEQNKRQPNAMKGRRLSEKQKQKLREYTKQQFATPEARKRHSEIMKTWMTDNIRKRISQSKMGHKQSNATKQKRSKSLKKVWDSYSPGERAKRIANMTEGLIKAKAKHYPGFVSPGGIRYENVYNLAAFCREHKLSRALMCRVAAGKAMTHQGWKALID